MKLIPFVIGWILLVIVFGVYIYGVYCAVSFNDNVDAKNGNLREPLDTLTATVGAILLTNLGAVLGISVSKPKSGIAKAILFVNTKATSPLTKREVIQLAALIIYLLVLIACFITWAIKKFEPDPAKCVALLVIQNSKSLIGVVSAYLAFVLGVKEESLSKNINSNE